jgi:sigma-B regulation protein RsbU (phosphoserine phosphatase)
MLGFPKVPSSPLQPVDNGVAGFDGDQTIHKPARTEKRQGQKHMTVLIADDDVVSRTMLESQFRKWGQDVLVAADGKAAWDILRTDHPPELAILDWIMPELDGLEVVKRVRALKNAVPTYIILLTVKGAKADIVTGLDSGADDYLPKPFDWDELRARLNVGSRMVALQRSLADRVRELEEFRSEIKVLQGLLPICGYCKKIRDDHNYWRQIETYITAHSEAHFSHCVCPDCYEKEVRPELEKDFGISVPYTKLQRG